MNYKASGRASAKPVVTLNSLRERQYALNRQMLLAVRLCDKKAQETIRSQLAELQEEINRITLRR